MGKAVGTRKQEVQGKVGEEQARRKCLARRGNAGHCLFLQGSSPGPSCSVRLPVCPWACPVSSKMAGSRNRGINGNTRLGRGRGKASSSSGVCGVGKEPTGECTPCRRLGKGEGRGGQQAEAIERTARRLRDEGTRKQGLRVHGYSR